jgi:hypothetical protein
MILNPILKRSCLVRSWGGSADVGLPKLELVK